MSNRNLRMLRPDIAETYRRFVVGDTFRVSGLVARPVPPHHRTPPRHPSPQGDTVTVTVLLHRDTIIERTGCPVCHAEAGRACWEQR